MLVSLRRDHQEIGPHGSLSTPPEAGASHHPLIAGYNTIRIERLAGSLLFNLYLNGRVGGTQYGCFLGQRCRTRRRHG